MPTELPEGAILDVRHLLWRQNLLRYPRQEEDHGHLYVGTQPPARTARGSPADGLLDIREVVAKGLRRRQGVYLQSLHSVVTTPVQPHTLGSETDRRTRRSCSSGYGKPETFQLMMFVPTTRFVSVSVGVNAAVGVM